jgi:hypothetical protein
LGGSPQEDPPESIALRALSHPMLEKLKDPWTGGFRDPRPRESFLSSVDPKACCGSWSQRLASHGPSDPRLHLRAPGGGERPPVPRFGDRAGRAYLLDMEWACSTRMRTAGAVARARRDKRLFGTSIVPSPSSLAGTATSARSSRNADLWVHRKGISPRRTASRALPGSIRAQLYVEGRGRSPTASSHGAGRALPPDAASKSRCVKPPRDARGVVRYRLAPALRDEGLGVQNIQE